MARPRTSPESRKSTRDPGHEGIKLFYALLVLSLAAAAGILIQQNGVFNWPIPDWSQDSADLDDTRIKMLYDDLDTAKQPFDQSGFNSKQILGLKPFWGTLNSGHYFGLKLSTPHSLETSLVWFENKLSRDGQLSIRHLCDQNDRLESYAWTQHDFWTFGQQIIQDGPYKLSTSYIKDKADSLDWQATIRADLANEARPLSIIQYITTNAQADTLKLETANKKPIDQGAKHIFSIRGTSSDLGRFKLDLESETKRDDSIIRADYIVAHVDKVRMPISTYLHSKMIIATHNKSRIFVLPSKIDLLDGQKANIIAIQLILKASNSLILKFTQLGQAEPSYSLSEYNERLVARTKKFDDRFARLFRIPSNATESRLARVALSNMLGAVGYFSGYSYIGSSENQEKIVPYGPIQLLTAVPSRSFFPRGFLWDEGFHNLLISQWDAELSNKIIGSWFDIMNRNGWIPREVILGAESMRRVPHEFLVQRIANANPPAMLLAIERMVQMGTLNLQSLEHLYPRLKQ